MSALLSANEAAGLASAEATIERGQKTFVEVGVELMKIRDNRWYRENYGSFAEYCEARWGWTKTHCNNLVQAAEVVRSLPAEVTTIVVNPDQANALSKVAPEKRAEVLQSAQRRGKVTAKAIQEAAEEVAPAEEETPRVKTYDKEFMAAMGNPKLSLSEEAQAVIDALNVQTENDKYLRDCIEGNSCDHDAIEGAIEHLQTLSKVLRKYLKGMK